MRYSIRKVVCRLLSFILFAVILASCKEDIDKDLAISSKPTITEFIQQNPSRFSEIGKLFERVKLGNKKDGSTLASVLSCRGVYTVFLPNNQGVAKYLEEHGCATVEELPDSLAELVTYSCIIDNHGNTSYSEAEFPTPGSFAQGDLNNRNLTCAQVVTEDQSTQYLISGTATTVETDIELSNGTVHEVDGVISPSYLSVYELVRNADNMHIMSRLLEITGWYATISQPSRDLAYEEIPHEATQNGFGNDQHEVYVYPDKRFINCYTGFFETDSVFQNSEAEGGWGLPAPKVDEKGIVTNWEEIQSQIVAKCQEAYPDAQGGTDFTDPDNAVNRFVAYHIIEGRMPFDRLVYHFNEYDYKYGDKRNPQNKHYPTNIWEYYTTVGKHRSLLKVTQVGENGFEHRLDHPIYLNRISVYDNRREGTYQELSVRMPGIKIEAYNGENLNDGVNGFYFPVHEVLVNTQRFRTYLGNERLRFSTSILFPEFLSGNYRGGPWTYFPRGYFKNFFNDNSSSYIFYKNGAWLGREWTEEGYDEFMIQGVSDFTIRMPPVPADGVYQIRLSTYTEWTRNMMQIYFGDDPNRLLPVGLPFDMRESPSEGNPVCTYFPDVEDFELNLYNNKKFAIQGYLKGPRYYINNQTNSVTLRDVRAVVRKIITTQPMRTDKTYYLRFKSVLDKSVSQFNMDFFEYAPSSIFNGETPEDEW